MFGDVVTRQPVVFQLFLHCVVYVILTQVLEGGIFGVFVEHHLHQEKRATGTDPQALMQNAFYFLAFEIGSFHALSHDDSVFGHQGFSLVVVSLQGKLPAVLSVSAPKAQVVCHPTWHWALQLLLLM
jgi:hypothetical protein